MALLPALEKKPELIIERYAKGVTAVHSQMSFNGKDICRAFENVNFLIPAGQYIAYQFKSAKFKRSVWRLVVKGHVGIEIHPANFATQLKGCFATTDQTTSQGGMYSARALDSLMEVIGNPPVLVIEVIDNYQV